MDTVTLDIHNGPITGTAQVSTDGFRKGQWKVSKEDKALEIDNCQIHSAVVKSDKLNLKVVQGKVVAALLAAEEKHAQSQADP